MRDIDEIRADIAKVKAYLPKGITNAVMDLCELEAELICALTAGIPIDRLEAICAAEREGQCAVRKACRYAEDTPYCEGTWCCSECGEEWTLNAGNPFENSMRFCPACGSEIEAITWEENGWDDEMVIRHLTRAESDAALERRDG